MKSYFDLVTEVLNQRAVIDNRNIVTLSETSQSVLIAFNQACEYMRDLHNWKWKKYQDVYLNDLGQDTYPIPYGIVEKVFYQKNSATEACELQYVDILTADTTCPTQWTFKWDTEEIQIDPATSAVTLHYKQVMYADNNIATLGVRTATGATKLQRFDTTLDTANQYLNVPEYIYDAYARCVILKTRVFLGFKTPARETNWNPAQAEWNEAYNGLMSYAKTPFYSK